MDIDLMLRVYPFFIDAAGTTILLSVLTALLGLTCGALGAAARLSRCAPAVCGCRAYVRRLSRHTRTTDRSF